MKINQIFCLLVAGLVLNSHAGDRGSGYMSSLHDDLRSILITGSGIGASLRQGEMPLPAPLGLMRAYAVAPGLPECNTALVDEFDDLIRAVHRPATPDDTHKLK